MSRVLSPPTRRFSGTCTNCTWTRKMVSTHCALATAATSFIYFRLLMQSCCFFFSRPFHENFKFLKNCPYDSHEILHSHSTPKGAAACAKASKSYGWDVRNIAKISPKMAKKTVIFRFSHKLFIRFERKRVRRKKT